MTCIYLIVKGSIWELSTHGQLDVIFFGTPGTYYPSFQQKPRVTMSQKEGRLAGYNCGKPDRANGSNKSSNKVTAHRLETVHRVFLTVSKEAEITHCSFE